MLTASFFRQDFCRLQGSLRTHLLQFLSPVVPPRSGATRSLFCGCPTATQHFLFPCHLPLQLPGYCAPKRGLTGKSTAPDNEHPAPSLLSTFLSTFLSTPPRKSGVEKRPSSPLEPPSQPRLTVHLLSMTARNCDGFPRPQRQKRK